MIGLPRVHHRTTDSTNERAKELALTGAPHGTVVTADEQSAGRGRQGRAWVASPGSALLMSVLLRDLGAAQAHLPLAAALAVCDACERSVPALRCTIKWPNDVWVDGRKLAGILIEGRPQDGWAVLGIGLNVSTGRDEFPEELRNIATSLAVAVAVEGPAAEVEAPAAGPGKPAPEANQPPQRDELLANLLAALEKRLAQTPERIVADWGERDALRGNQIRWQQGEGTARGIDETGALMVDTSSGRVTLDAGEVHLLR